MSVFVWLRLEGIADSYIVSAASSDFIVIEFTVEYVVDAKLYRGFFVDLVIAVQIQDKVWIIGTIFTGFIDGIIM